LDTVDKGLHVKGGERGAVFARHFAVLDELGFAFLHLGRNDVIEAFKAKPVVVATRNLGRSYHWFLARCTNTVLAIARDVCAWAETDFAPISTA
jgi:hypothetical protein